MVEIWPLRGVGEIEWRFGEGDDGEEGRVLVWGVGAYVEYGCDPL